MESRKKTNGMIQRKSPNLAILFHVFRLCLHREIEMNLMVVNHQNILSSIVIPKVRHEYVY